MKNEIAQEVSPVALDEARLDQTGPVKDFAATDRVLGEIALERVAQDAKWGEQNHPILPIDPSMEHHLRMEERQARAVYERHADEGMVSWYDILREEFCEVFIERNPPAQRHELIQVAAVAVAMVECIDRASKNVP